MRLVSAAVVLAAVAVVVASSEPVSPPAVAAQVRPAGHNAVPFVAEFVALEAARTNPVPLGPPDAATVHLAPVPGPPTTPVPAAKPGAVEVAGVLVQAYRAAVAASPAACNLPVELLAAIGQIESGSAGGRQITADHRVVPPIYGPVLSGGPFAAISDSDAGRLDGDTRWDRAVGPMQFIPSTWASSGVDGDGDGTADPQNVFDAARSAAGYLCAHGRDLSQKPDRHAALWSYNQSLDYRDAVLAWMAYFTREGLGSIGKVAVLVRGSSPGDSSSTRASGVRTAEARPTSSPSPTLIPAAVATTPSTSTPTPTTTTPAPTTPAPTTTTTPTPRSTTASVTLTSPPTTSPTPTPTTTTVAAGPAEESTCTAAADVPEATPTPEPVTTTAPVSGPSATEPAGSEPSPAAEPSCPTQEPTAEPTPDPTAEATEGSDASDASDTSDTPDEADEPDQAEPVPTPTSTTTSLESQVSSTG